MAGKYCAWLIVVCLVFRITFSMAAPMHSETEKHDLTKKEQVAVPELYKHLSLHDIPTTIEGLHLSNKSQVRYGYEFGRPADRFLHFPLSLLFKRVLYKIPTFLHWGLVVSTEPPLNLDYPDDLPRSGTKVRRPETGISFELRNSPHTGLIYLDVKNWTNYDHRPKYVKFRGTLTQSDEELVRIGRVYIQQIGKEGFHNFYRNCQIFTSWFLEALWDRPGSTKRADQLLGKFIWWFKDWKKTRKWSWYEIKNSIGVKSKVPPPMDESAMFIDLDELLPEEKSLENSLAK
jgi:hypothetical protein